MGKVFRKDKLKGRVGQSTTSHQTYTGSTYLVQLVAKVYGVDIIAL